MAKTLPAEVVEFFRRHGARGGRIGGKRSLETMTAAERSARAKKASLAGVKARRKKAAARKATAKKAIG
jgi:uncharacterized protein YdaU (DUF1376 family)